MVVPNREAAYRLRASHSNTNKNGFQSTTTPRRRRGQEQVTTTTNNNPNWNGNGLGATNDSAEYKPTIKVVNGYPVNYSCEDDPRQAEHDIAGRKVQKLSVLFDYEVVIHRNADFAKNLQSLEWSVLWNVAETIGLHVCDFDRLSGKDRRRKLEDRDSFVLGLSSLARDEVDRDIDQCTFLEDTRRQNAVCTPIRGRMSANYVGDPDFVKQLLLRKIEQEMNSGRTRIEDVTTIRFVGDRDGANNFTPDRTMDELDPSRNTATSLALIIGIFVAAAVLFIIPLLILRGRRKRQTAAAESETVLRLDGKDDEVVPPAKSGDTEDSDPEKCSKYKTATACAVGSGSARTVASTVSSTGAVASAATTVNSTGAVASAATTVSSTGAVASVATITSTGAVASELVNSDCSSHDDNSNASTTVSDDTYQQPVEPTSCRVLTACSTLTNKESTAPTQDEVTVATELANNLSHPAADKALPPLPPLPVVPADQKEPAKSKTLQPRRKRKKKKKKKKPVLKRVSSRNSIDEMETIREDDEETEDDDEEEGSEYSTDDEEEPFAGLVDSDEPAVMPPSPIHEEPKIRRLPPPWI